MKDFVSSYWIRVVALSASMSVVCACFVLYGFPWTSLALASLTLSAAVLLVMSSPGSIRLVLRDLQAEAQFAVATPEHVVLPVCGAPLRFQGERTP